MAQCIILYLIKYCCIDGVSHRVNIVMLHPESQSVFCTALVWYGVSNKSHIMGGNIKPVVSWQ